MAPRLSFREHNSGSRFVRFTEVDGLPWFSVIYRQLKANPKTAWIAQILKTPLFWRISKLLALILYFAIGIAYYCPKQGWGVGSTMFFTVVTMTTVAYGYHHPTDDEGRIFTIFYIFVGVYFIFLFVADWVMEMLSFAMQFMKSRFGKADMAMEYRYLRWIIYANIAAIILTLLIGAGCLMALEGWDFVTALYFAVETSTTVAYGDIQIQNKEQTYPFLCCYMIFSTVLVVFAINNMSEARLKRKRILKVSEMLLKNKDLAFLTQADDEGRGISEAEFVLSVLIKLGIIDEDQDVSQWRSRFRALAGSKSRIYPQEIDDLKGTDALDTQERIKELMRKSGISLDVMETASMQATFSIYNHLFHGNRKKEEEENNFTRKRSMSVDAGGIQFQRKKSSSTLINFRDVERAVSRHSDLR